MYGVQEYRVKCAPAWGQAASFRSKQRPTVVDGARAIDDRSAGLQLVWPQPEQTEVGQSALQGTRGSAQSRFRTTVVMYVVHQYEVKCPTRSTAMSLASRQTALYARISLSVSRQESRR